MDFMLSDLITCTHLILKPRMLFSFPFIWFFVLFCFFSKTGKQIHVTSVCCGGRGKPQERECIEGAKFKRCKSQSKQISEGEEDKVVWDGNENKITKEREEQQREEKIKRGSFSMGKL